METADEDTLQRQAEIGDIQGQYDFGMKLVRSCGSGVSRSSRPNFEKGIHWLRLASKQGHTAAQCALGEYLVGDEGKQWLLQAERRGCAAASLLLARNYQYSDYITAVEHFEIAARLGHPEALFSLHRCSAHGLGVAKNPEKADRYLQLAAEAGHSVSLFWVGIRFEDDDDESRRDYSLSCFQRAAQQGHGDSRLKLYRYFRDQNNDEAAVKWLRAAADESDNIMALEEIGKCYRDGLRGLPQDIAVAEEYFAKVKQKRVFLMLRSPL